MNTATDARITLAAARLTGQLISVPVASLVRIK